MIKSEVINSMIKERFEYAFDEFNFYKVKVVMDTLDWTWALTAGRVPSTKNMVDTVRSLFETALEQKKTGQQCAVSTGGFEVEITEDNTVNIRFIVEDTTSIGYDE